MKKLSAVLLASLCIATLVWALPKDNYTRTEDVIYGRKFGTALTMDVITPKKPNGYGIISIISGGWFSSHEAIDPAKYQALLDHGYTVFAVVHGAQPKFTIPEIIQDINRATRFIRYNSSKYGINPKHIGVTGGSAGGHLSLMLGTQAQSDPPNSKDPIDQESSVVQCIACFFPPTDFLNYGAPDVLADGVGKLEQFRPAFGPLANSPKGQKVLGHELSPIYFLSSNFPPTLIFHGDADDLVPLQQSESFAKRAQELGATVKVIVKPGKGHGWPDWGTVDMPVAADWFDKYLRGIKPPSSTR